MLRKKDIYNIPTELIKKHASKRKNQSIRINFKSLSRISVAKGTLQVSIIKIKNPLYAIPNQYYKQQKNGQKKYAQGSVFKIKQEDTSKQDVRVIRWRIPTNTMKVQNKLVAHRHRSEGRLIECTAFRSCLSTQTLTR